MNSSPFVYLQFYDENPLFYDENLRFSDGNQQFYNVNFDVQYDFSFF